MRPIVKMKDFKVVDGKVVINQQTQQDLTLIDLQNAKFQIGRRKQQLIQQSQQLKQEFDGLTSQEAEIDEMIAALPKETINTIGGQ